MKKAKIFLTALTVLTVVGGALAFKAKTQAVFGTCNITTQVCELDTFKAFETTIGGNIQRNYDLATKPCVNNVCQTLVKASL